MVNITFEIIIYTCSKCPPLEFPNPYANPNPNPNQLHDYLEMENVNNICNEA